MEKHFLEDTIEGTPDFQAEPWYNPYGDCIVYQVADEAVIAERLDELMTLYRSATDRRLVGFQIKGVQAIIRKFGLEGLMVASETGGGRVKNISITTLLLAAYEEGPRTLQRRSAYASAMEYPFERRSIPADELQPA